jgi:predicted alpha/beta superfamily hydrolase
MANELFGPYYAESEAHGMLRTIIIISIFFNICSALPQSAIPTTPQPGVAIVCGERFVLHSDLLGEDRTYSVHLPKSYSSSRPMEPRRYPVIYLLDGDEFFQPVSGLVQYLSEGSSSKFKIPEQIVVAIHHADRTHDLTPTHVSEFPTSGGAKLFMEFIEEELIPEIDTNFRTLPSRTLIGHSLGALFAMNEMMGYNPRFQAYLAIDPSLWWEQGYLVKIAKFGLGGRNSLRRTVYLGFSGIAHPAQGLDRQFAAMLRASSAPGFRVMTQTFKEEDPGSVPIVAIYQGLRHLFAGSRSR